MSEATFQRWIQKRVRELGGEAHKDHGGPFSSAGWPDLLVMFGCWYGLIETKAPGGRLSKIQRYTHDSLRAKGIPVFVVESFEEAEEAIDTIRSL